MAQNIPSVNFLVNQATELPPDQSQLNSADGSIKGLPAYLLPPQQAAAPQGPAPTPAAQKPQHMFQDQKPSAKATVPNPQSNAGGGGGLQSYLANDDLKDAMDQARTSRQANMDAISNYIDQLKSQPNQINWSPLAAMIDGMNGGKTNLLKAAQDTAPMSPDDKQKMIAGLQMQLGGLQDKGAQEDLGAIRAQMQAARQAQQDQERQRHDMATEAFMGGKGEAQMIRARTGQDTQAAQAGTLLDKDPIILQAQKQQNQIALDTHTLNNPNTIITPAIMDEISTGIGNALAGGKAASLEATKMQQINSADRDFAKLRQYIENKPVAALSADNQNQLNSVLDRLNQGYGHIAASRANQVAQSRNYQYNPNAQQTMMGKVNALTQAAEGTGASAAPAAPAAPSYGDDVLNYAQTHGLTPAAAQKIKDGRMAGGQ